MSKFAWFEVGDTLVRVSPRMTVEDMQSMYPNKQVRENHFYHEAKMVLAMPFSKRQPYIDSTPADQRDRLKEEIKRQFKGQKIES